MPLDNSSVHSRTVTATSRIRTKTALQNAYLLPSPLPSPSPNPHSQHRRTDPPPSPYHRPFSLHLFQCHFNAQNIRLQSLCEFTSFEPNQRVNTLRAFCFFNIHFIGFIIVVLIIRIVHWSPRNAIHSLLFIGWTLSFFIFIDGDSRNGICSLIGMRPK